MINSRDNQRFKSWMKLKLKKYRDETGLFLVYGKKMVDLALSHGIVDEVITIDEFIEGTLIDLKLMKELSQTETTHNVMAVCKKISKRIESKNVLVLDDLQNPDNVGALLRSALAFGFNHVVLSKNSADIYNDKTIRASSGAIFDLFIERLDLLPFLKEMKENSYQLFGADAHVSDNQPIGSKPFVLVLGNEGNGLSTSVKEVLDGFIRIETQTVESLNVAVAGSILMYAWGVK